jgi:hypothetical protein
MSATVLWALLGLALLGAAAFVIIRLGAATLGPYSTRLLALAATIAGYYGALSLSRFFPAPFHPERVRLLHYLVPVAGGLGLLYCLVNVVRNWRSEVHGLLQAALRLMLLIALAALARLCFTL